MAKMEIQDCSLNILIYPTEYLLLVLSCNDYINLTNDCICEREALDKYLKKNKYSSPLIPVVKYNASICYFFLLYLEKCLDGFLILKKYIYSQ